MKQFDLRGATDRRRGPRVAVDRGGHRWLCRNTHELPAFPAVGRDINLVCPRRSAGPTWRRSSRDQLRRLRLNRWSSRKSTATTPCAAGCKSMLFSLTLRSREATLTNAEADAIRDCDRRRLRREVRRRVASLKSVTAGFASGKMSRLRSAAFGMAAASLRRAPTPESEIARCRPTFKRTKSENCSIRWPRSKPYLPTPALQANAMLRPAPWNAFANGCGGCKPTTGPSR